MAISRWKTNIEEKGLHKAGYSKREDDGDENIERLVAQTRNQKRNDATRDEREYDQDEPDVMNREEQALLVTVNEIKGRGDEKREHEEGHREQRDAKALGPRERHTLIGSASRLLKRRRLGG